MTTDNRPLTTDSRQKKPVVHLSVKIRLDLSDRNSGTTFVTEPTWIDIILIRESHLRRFSLIAVSSSFSGPDLRCLKNGVLWGLK